MEDILDLSNMGYRETAMAAELLQAYAKERPEAWVDSGVKLACNNFSGNVFLVNDEYQILMMNGEKAEVYYCLSWDGHEGFINDLYDDFKAGYIDENNYEDLARYLRDEHMYKEAEEVEKCIKKERSHE